MLSQQDAHNDKGDKMIKLNELKCINKNIDLNKYILFRDSVKSNMEHPEWLGDFSYDELLSVINNNGRR